MGITPPIQKYQPVIERLQDGIRKAEFNGVSRITQAFRDRYYDIVKRTLVEKRQIIPCLAGVASAQIAPNGDVWTCCIRAESVGNLRELVTLGRRSQPRKPMSCAVVSRPENAIVRWPTRLILICSAIRQHWPAWQWKWAKARRFLCFLRIIKGNPQSYAACL